MEKITALRGPDGLRVSSVPLTGSYGVWARFGGLEPMEAALEVTRGGGLVAFHPTIASLAAAVDLAELSPA